MGNKPFWADHNWINFEREFSQALAVVCQALFTSSACLEGHGDWTSMCLRLLRGKVWCSISRLLTARNWRFFLGFRVSCAIERRRTFWCMVQRDEVPAIYANITDLCVELSGVLLSALPSTLTTKQIRLVLKRRILSMLMEKRNDAYWTEIQQLCLINQAGDSLKDWSEISVFFYHCLQQRFPRPRFPWTADFRESEAQFLSRGKN